MIARNAEAAVMARRAAWFVEVVPPPRAEGRGGADQISQDWHPPAAAPGPNVQNGKTVVKSVLK
jgi:hypothetical protein